MDICEILDTDKKSMIHSLKNNTPLTGKFLELALESIDSCLLRNNDKEDNFSKFLKDISNKIITGLTLTAYEIQVISEIISTIDYEEKRKERKSIGAKLGHIKRRLSNNEPLTGKTLDLAMELLAMQGDSDLAKFARNISVKIEAGQPLDEYEYHIFIDVLILHTKLGI